MAAITDAEQAVNDATPAWRALPTTQARIAELRAAIAGDGHGFDADGMTAVLKAFSALNKANPIPDVHEAIARNLV